MSDNLPAPVTFAEFSERMRCLKALHGGSVTSGARTEQRNTAVGGVENSYHRLSRGGLAEDIVLNRMTQAKKMAFVSDALTLGIRALDEGDHIHCQPNSW